jgi:hypothetical protein
VSNTTALDLIKGALRRIGSYQSGEAIAPADAQDALDTLNDMLDSWSTDKYMVFGSNENIVQYTSGQNTYTVGNPLNSVLGLGSIVGSISGPTITTTYVPPQLVVGVSPLTASTITDLGNVVPAGTFATAASGFGGAGTITLSQPIVGSYPGNDTFNWTVPGNFGFARPLRITYGFTRFNALDFPFDVYTSLERYNDILYKALPGPWPVVAWWNPQDPYGQLKFYQTPSNSGECHLFTDTILANLTLNQTFVLPQGYTRAIKWCLAKEICAEYGYPLTDVIKLNAGESLALIKALNAQPPQVSRYDRALLHSSRVGADWILHGGYR